MSAEHTSSKSGDHEAKPAQTESDENPKPTVVGSGLKIVRSTVGRLAEDMLKQPPLDVYADEHSAITDGARQGLEELAGGSVALYRVSIDEDLRHKWREEELAAPLKRAKALGPVSWGLLTVGVLAAWLGILLLDWSITWVRNTLPFLDFAEPVPSFVVAGLLLVLGVAARAGYVTRTSTLETELASSLRRKDDARNKYLSTLHTGIRQELNAALSRVLDSSDTVPVRVGSLQLVETRRSEVIESRAVLNVLNFIDTHEASALGLAGQRGIGKTTILQHLVQTTAKAHGLAVMVTVPVLYEPEALVRRIYSEFIRQASAEEPGFTPVEATPPPARALTPAQVITVVVGAAAAFCGVTLWSSPDAFRSWLSDPVRAAAGSLVAVGYVLMLVGLIEPLRRLLRYRRLRDPLLRADHKSRRLEYVLHEAAGLLRWEEERSSADEITAELPAKLFASTRSSSVKHTRLPIGRPELAQHFRRTVEEYVRHWENDDHRVRTRRRVLICVDELDKIENSKSALNLVNELKDLMHIEGTHFLLSVSEDALRSFSLRGVDVRDAVDSTFDEVFEVRGLTASESHRVIVQRAPEFPPPLTRFCHAWSLGVPRDLLRAARHCIAVGADSTGARRQLGALVRDVVGTDVRDAVTAQLARTGVTNLSDNDRALLLQSLDERDTTTLRELLVKHRSQQSDQLLQLEWQSILSYLDYACKVLDVFGVERKYGDWRVLDSEGSLDKTADDLVAQERRSRLI